MHSCVMGAVGAVGADALVESGGGNSANNRRDKALYDGSSDGNAAARGTRSACGRRGGCGGRGGHGRPGEK